MKKKITKSILSWLLVISMVIPSLSSALTAQAADGDIKNYDAMTMEEIFDSEESLTWVITGDSITHNGGWTAGLNSYGEWMEQYLLTNGRSDDSVVLSGWGGAATEDFQTLENTPSGAGTKDDPGMGIENFITKYNPDVVTIKLGMNDRYKTKAKFIENYKKMLDSLYEICETEHKKIPKVILLTPTPIASESFLDDKVNGEVADGVFESTTRQRNAIEQIVNEYNAAGKHLLFCDLRTAFLTAAEELGEDYVSVFFQDPSDGAIHPNAAGQYCIFKTLAKTLGIYDENNSIFQIEYDDLVYHALYADSTDGVTYAGDYGKEGSAESSEADLAEMNKTMPTVSDVAAISSVEFTSDNGVLDMGEKEGFSVSSEGEGIDVLTQEEAAALTDSFSVVFRAKLGAAYNTNQPVLFVSASGTANWDNALVLGVPGSANQLYYNLQEGKMNAKIGQINFEGTSVAGDGNWHTIATTYNAGTVSYYVDGTLVGSTAGFELKEGVTIGSLFADSTDFQAQIGRFGIEADGTTYKLNGSFDYWQFYDKALTAEQIASISPAVETVKIAKWNDIVGGNYTWAVAGGAQMAGYDGVTVNRSLLRYLENALRGGDWTYRDLHVYSLASADYNMETLVAKYDALAEERNFEVFMLLPEVPEVFANDYTHSAEKVAAYKSNVETLISKNSGKSVVLWTPLASGNTTINGYINDYANAVREIVAANSSVLFFDANKFMNDNMANNASLVNNWFEDGEYLSPLGSVDVARAYYEAMTVNIPGKSELKAHNLRYTSDAKIYKGAYVKDNIASTASVNGTTVTVDLSAVAAAYPNAELSIKVLPYKTVENYNAKAVNLVDVAEVAVDGNVYTFDAPCADLHLAIYGEENGVIYRFKDIALNVETSKTITAAAPDGVYLNSLEVMSAPAFDFDKDTTAYNVDLYQYQSHVAIRATAQAGLTIKVNGEVVASGANSQFIEVEDGSVVTVEVTDGTETKTYTLTLSRPVQPDIIITEVMTDGYYGYTASGNDNYELIEIYNASGKDLNLLDYSVAYKKDYTYNTVNVGNGSEFPYYFVGNNLLVSKETHAGIKELTKYSMYWEDKVEEEPEEVLFKADSTMVIWVKFSPQDTAEKRAEYGAKLTYETLIGALETEKGKSTLTVDIDGKETAVVPKESQIVVAEVKEDMKSGSINGAAGVKAENSQKNWYLENHGAYNAGGQQTRSWLFILKDSAEIAQNYKVTEAGNDIISAAKYVRSGSTNKLSSVFSYNYERGMSLVKNESYINNDLVGKANTSDVMGYSNLTSFGAIEYWQKPVDFADTTAPEIVDVTNKETAIGSPTTVDVELKDDTDVRFATVYARKVGETAYKAYTKDFVLETTVKNEGLAVDVKEVASSFVIADTTGETDSFEYYVEVVDGNNHVTTLGSADAPYGINSIPKVVNEYKVADAKKYIGKKAPACDVEGYIFSGWYADKKCEATPIASKEEADAYETVYALFVPKAVLGTKAQINAHLENTDVTDDATGNIRFVTSVDSENYKKVGFNVSYDADGDGVNKLYKITTSNIYRSLEYMDTTDGSVMEYYPNEEFHMSSKYFMAVTVKGMTEPYYEMDFKVTPFWVTMDGVTVKGATEIKRVNDRVADFYEAKDSKSYYVSLEDAVNAADGTITLFSDAEVESAMAISGSITLQNRPGRTATIYRGAGLAKANMFDIATTGTLTITGDDASSIVFDGRTVAEAEADKGRDAAAGSTGSIFSNFGNLNLENVTAQYVKKTSGTGGVINNNSDNKTNANATVTIESCVFDNNFAASYGAGMYSRGKSSVKNTVFTNNKSNANGVAICNHSGASFVVDGCTFEGNSGAAGGAIWNNMSVTIQNSTFKSNVASGNSGAIENSGANLKVIGCKFEGNTAGGHGGAINNSAAGLSVENCVFKSNTSAANGGAIQSGKDHTIKYCTFEGNTAAKNGGAVYNSSSATLTITGDGTDKSVFKNNKSLGAKTKALDDGTYYGGGAICVGSGSLTINSYKFIGNETKADGGAITFRDGNKALVVNDCEFVSNKALKQNGIDGYGGAIHMFNGTLKIDVDKTTVTTFDGNQATNGGAVYQREWGSLNIHNAKFTSNYGQWNGGALYHKKEVTLVGCEFTSNTTVSRGGAVCSEGGVFNATNCTFTGNTADNEGGAYRLASGGKATITGCTFTNNTAKDVGGGAIKYNTGTLTIDGCTFSGNTATKGDANGHDIKLDRKPSATDYVEPTIKNSTFNPINVRNGAGTAETFVDGGGNTLLTDELDTGDQGGNESVNPF